MVKRKARSTGRRDESLSRDRIIQASIALLDHSGEDGLTFRALSKELATGPGTLYWYFANKSELLTTACDTIIADIVTASPVAGTPKANIRALTLRIFGAMDAHPWVGSALTRAPGELPVVRILERIGQQLRALDVPAKKQWAVSCALLNYILGVSGQNSANSQIGRERGLDRDLFLEAISAAWLRLDPDEYPFTRSVAGQLVTHDDRADLLAGIDLILRGLAP